MAAEDIPPHLVESTLQGIPWIAEREGHNILTNVGRAWLRNLVGAKSYANIGGSTGYIEGTSYVLTSERIAYMAYGVGGALQTDTQFYRTQEELVTVTTPEDWVKVTATDYFKQVLPQTTANGSFPDGYTIRFTGILASSEVSFSANTSHSSVAVGTDVPVSEAGLYLSGSTVTEEPNYADNATRMVAYNIFAPLRVTTNVVLRIDWDFLF
jgi:hypothetical protein